MDSRRFWHALCFRTAGGTSVKNAWTAHAFDTATADLARNSQPGGPFFGIHASNHGRVIIFAGVRENLPPLN